MRWFVLKPDRGDQKYTTTHVEFEAEFIGNRQNVPTQEVTWGILRRAKRPGSV